MFHFTGAFCLYPYSFCYRVHCFVFMVFCFLFFVYCLLFIVFCVRLLVIVNTHLPQLCWLLIFNGLAEFLSGGIKILRRNSINKC